ncbi:MAG: GNAT family N-acetyltransferase [Alphaproteobacteria bacterium]|nr:GNAT family N-acetyltransferase [Alphaproteobacteria bacterium]
MSIRYVEGIVPDQEALVALYSANGWSSAKKPIQLAAALGNSDHLIVAYEGDRLVGLANAISDGHLVVYYPHLLVEPETQGKGVGLALMTRMLKKYKHVHQHMLTAVADAVGFYKRVGFEKAGTTIPMWIYEGGDT